MFMNFLELAKLMTEVAPWSKHAALLFVKFATIQGFVFLVPNLTLADL